MNNTTAEIITIGNELLGGLTQDTNSYWLSVRLSRAGFTILQKTTVGDSKEQILAALAAAEKRVDIVVITGGLGPTSDDLTKPCLATFFDCAITPNQEALKDVAQFFKCEVQALTKPNRAQAALPVCCQKIANTIGTAPGMWFDKKEKVFVAMPGVPSEMKKMMREVVIPRLKNIFKPPVLHHHIICTAGIGESFLSEKIAVWEQALPSHIRLAYLPSFGRVRLCLTGSGNTAKKVKSELIVWGDKLRPLVGKYIYGYGDDSLELIVGNMLRAQNLTLSVAESCTGGHTSHRITCIPGSSDYYLGGIVAYDNAIKIRQLDVNPATLKKHGAVSEPIVIEMANAVRTLFNTHIGIATSGVAGPGGATPKTPLGTVWIALADGKKTTTKRLNLSSNRLSNIRYTSSAALDMIRKHLVHNLNKGQLAP